MTQARPLETTTVDGLVTVIRPLLPGPPLAGRPDPAYPDGTLPETRRAPNGRRPTMNLLDPEELERLLPAETA